MTLTEEQRSEWDMWIQVWKAAVRHGTAGSREETAIAIDQHLRDQDAALAEIRRVVGLTEETAWTRLCAIDAILRRLDGETGEQE